ncbi:MAG: competence/damage-inducible protein A [Oscillospiraceae bacterium]
MNAEILCVGTELLLGDTVNTNAAYIARGLSQLGINCYCQTVVGDNPGRLADALSLALGRSDMVITTGGLGPTYDDLTKETVADWFGRKMELHQESYDHLVELFRRFDRPMTDNNKKQAMMPEGAVVFPNDRGTADGLAVEGRSEDEAAGHGKTLGKTVILLPGPPREMTAMFDNQVKPYLMAKSDHVLLSRNVHFFGIGESQLEQDLRNYMLEHTNPTVAPYAKEGEVLLRVTAYAPTAEEAFTLTGPVVEDLLGKYPGLIYGVDVDSLQNALVLELKAKGLTVATAESCTGGLISKRITEIDGSSAVFGWGVASYANEAKMKLLGVSPETLTAHGAVSKETALEMARGVRKLSGADIGVSVTGIAGPSGGTPEKPVGLVYIAASREGDEEWRELHLSRSYGGEREFVRYAASSHALHLALTMAKGFGE